MPFGFSRPSVPSTLEEHANGTRHEAAEATQHRNLEPRHAAELTDSAGVLTDDYTWDAWGNLRAESGTTDNPFRFVARQGYWFDDETGRYNLRRRDYDPATGRFLSEDTGGQSPTESNLYRYAANDPTNEIDPSGLLFGITVCDVLNKVAPDFCDTMSAFGGVVAQLYNGRWDNTKQAVVNFLEGAKQGFQNFLSNIVEHFKKALGQWLGVPSQIFTFNFANASLKDYAGLLIDLLGYDWDSLLEMVQAAVGPTLFSAIVRLLEELQSFFSDGPGKWVEQKVQELKDLLTNLVSDVWSMVQSMIRTAVQAVIETGVRAAIVKIIAMLNPAGAIWTVLSTLYNVAK